MNVLFFIFISKCLPYYLRVLTNDPMLICARVSMPSNPSLGPFCTEFACSPCGCVGSVWYPGFLPWSKNMIVCFYQS